MNPLAFSAFVARFGPWFGRIAAATPEILANLVAKLRLAAPKVFTGETVRDVVAFAKANPVNATLILTTLASLGVSVMDLFGGPDEQSRLQSRVDPQTRDFFEALSRLDRRSSVSDTAYNAEVKAADSSAVLDLKLASNSPSNEVAIEILSYANKFFGSRVGAIESHRLLQAFLEMPHADVIAGFAELRLR